VGLVDARARAVAHRAFLFAFAAILLAIVADGFLPRKAALLLGALGAGLAVLAYVRTRGPAIWLAFASPAPIAFVALFLLGSQVAPLLRAPAGALGATVGRRTPTIVVVFDELPLASLLDAGGGIDADLFPNFARLAGTSTWFRQTTAASNYTWLAVPAILTGEDPEGRSVATSTDHPENLFTLVGGAMPITSSEAVTRLCPAAICERLDAHTGGLGALLGDARSVIAQRLDPAARRADPMAGQVEDDLGEPVEAEGGDELDAPPMNNARFERFLDRLDDGAGGLRFLHLLLPHGPYRFLPDGTTYDPPDPEPGRFLDGWGDEQRYVDLSRQRHLLQLRYADGLLGDLLDRLEANGELDRSNLVVVADHGIAFDPGAPSRILDTREVADGRNDATVAQLAWVPFFVKRAGQQEGEVSDDPVRTVDVTPTVADLLDVDLPWDADGRSAYEGGSGRPDEVSMVLADVDGARAGPTRTLDRSTGWQLVLDRAGATFAPPVEGVRGADRIVARGPRPDLWGEPLPAGSFPVVGWEPVGTDPRDETITARHVPAVLRVRVQGVAVGQAVAVTVGGTVWATTRTYADGQDVGAVVVLPARAFRDGADDVSVRLLDQAP